MARKLWIFAAMALLSGSCTRTTSHVQSQGQTHWWKSCDKDADCGEQTDLSCICSVCMAECTQSGSSCEVEGRAAECFGSNADAVQAFCGATPAQAPVCLEPCESECGDGFRCDTGACIAIEPQATAGSGAAGSGAAGGGAAGTGEQDGGPAQPVPMPVTIELLNISDTPLYAQTQGCSGLPSWFGIDADGKSISPILSCTADCATDPNGPQGCPPVCHAAKFQMLEPNGGAIRFEWDGLHWAADPRGCANHVAVELGKTIDVTFCWLTELPPELAPGIPGEPSGDDVTCASYVAAFGSTPTFRHAIAR